jgi:leucyl aminopeptidase
MIEEKDGATQLIPVGKKGFSTWLGAQPAAWSDWVKVAKFKGEQGAICAVPDEKGIPSILLVGLGANDDPWIWASLPSRLPPGAYRITLPLDRKRADWAALGWLLGCYSFDQYKKREKRELPRLIWPENCDKTYVMATMGAIGMTRDMINTPASDMGPVQLAQAALNLGNRFNAKATVIVGEELQTQNYPMIYAVGQAAASGREPRLIDFVWGEESHPKVTLVGKGVCFDSGGLDLKTSAGMKLMKKDMGGAAHVLGLAAMIMAAKLPVRLRVLIPAVENSVSGNAMRPLDVLQSRKGITVEIGNTDAEGRLILADALWEAGTEKPDLLIDFATLTGAARSALGTELPALFSNNTLLANRLLAAGESEHDPMWRLPLHQSYRRMLDSRVADINNASDSPYAGAITAALFLQEFVPPSVPWAHLDVMAWNPSSRPGRPEGGEALCLRSVYSVISQHYIKK